MIPIRNKKILTDKKDGVVSKLDENQGSLDTKKHTENSNKTRLKECEGKLKEIEKGTKGDKAAVESLNTDKQSFLDTVKTHIDVLKGGLWKDPKAQKNHQTAVKKLLDDLSVPKSLVNALPFALNDKPDSRKSFDNTTITELDKIIKGRISELDQQIQSTQKVIAEKESKKPEVEKAVETAKNLLMVSTEAVAGEEAIRQALQSDLKDAQKAIKQHQSAVKSAGQDLEEAQSSMEKLKSVMAQFIELRDRMEATTPAPAEKAAEAAAEAKGAAEAAKEAAEKAKSPAASPRASVTKPPTSAETKPASPRASVTKPPTF